MIYKKYILLSLFLGITLFLASIILPTKQKDNINNIFYSASVYNGNVSENNNSKTILDDKIEKKIEYNPTFKGKKLLPPNIGIYHGAFADFGPREDIVTEKRITDFKELVDKDIAWGYFSDNWFEGINFPKEKVKILHENGVVPFIRLMPRSRFQEGGIDPIYTLQKIIDGVFDEELRQWARDAKDLSVPLLIEFGTEVNGNWFTWSGNSNGGGVTNNYGDPFEPDGPERFRDAYKHIIDIFREEEAFDITWFFHPNLVSTPNVYWNRPELYYPGDDYIDWIGVSVYGAQHKKESWNTFSKVMNTYFHKIEKISENKPIAILEFGVIEKNNYDKGQWINNALQTILSGKYPKIKAISYWHSNWTNKDGSQSKMRIDSSYSSLEQYKNVIQDQLFVTIPKFSN